jgi:hypothetical protein
MLRPKASILPAPPPRSLAEEIAVDVLEIVKRDGKQLVCYICHESDRVEPSPCKCEAPCHVYPCLELSVEQNGDPKCTICRGVFSSSALRALAASVPKIEVIEVSAHYEALEGSVEAHETCCSRLCARLMAASAHLCLVFSVGFLIYLFLHFVDFLVKSSKH